MTEHLTALHQNYVDAHSGLVYRLGDDSEIDAVHERRWSLYLDHVASQDESSYYLEMTEATSYIEDERAALRFPDVERRLTTHERRKRGLRDSKPV